MRILYYTTPNKLWTAATNTQKKYKKQQQNDIVGHYFHSCASKETTNHFAEPLCQEESTGHYLHSRTANNPHIINSHHHAASSRILL